MKKLATRHIVIGGGLIGMLSAFYLRKAGQEVCIIERGEIGHESSWAGGGILSPLYPWRYPEAVTQLASWSQNNYPALIQQLLDNTNIDAQLNRCGMLVLDNSEIDSAVQWAQTHNKTLQVVKSTAVPDITPDVNSNILPQQALWFPDIAQIRNPRMIKAMKKQLTQLAVGLLDNTPVSKIVTRNGQLSGIVADGKLMETDSATIACGAWSSTLLKDYPLSKTIEPVRGQMIVIRAEPQLLNTIVLCDSHYLIPRLDGRILVGSTLEYVGFNKDKTQQAKQQLYQFAIRICPKLVNFPIEHHWAGLRPGTKSQIPLITEHPQIKGLFVNTGHFRNGVVTAPASAKLLSDLILGNKPIIDRKAYTA